MSRDGKSSNSWSNLVAQSPLTPTKWHVLAAEFRKIRARHVAGVASMIRTGITKAFDIVVDAQPKYAAEKAALWNHLGMRYHVVWALALSPELIAMFYAQPDRTGLC